MKFSEVITKDQGKVHAKGQGQRSKVKVTELTSSIEEVPYRWHWNEAQMSQKLSWRDLFVQIELGVDITSLGFK